MSAPEPPDSNPLPLSETVVDAVVADGQIRPLSPLNLPEGTRLQLRISARITAVVTSLLEGEQPLAGSDRPPRGPLTPSPQRSPRARQRSQRRLAAAPAPLKQPFARLLTTARPALIIIACVLTLFGQIALQQELAFSSTGFGLVLGGALLLALALFDQRPYQPARPVAPEPPTPPVRLTSPLRLSALALVAGGSAGLLYVFQAAPPWQNLLWTFPAWALLIALYSAAVLPAPRLRWGAPFSKLSLLSLLSLAIFLVALAVRGWDVGNIPGTLSGDEGRFGVEIRHVLAGTINNPFSTGWLSVPTMTFFYNAPSVALLGNTMFALRIPWALMGALNVLTVFWLATRLQGPAVGVVTACLLALYHYHIHFSRLGINNIADPFFTALALLLLFRAYDERSLADWVLCGVVTGVGQYFYFGARFIAIVVVASIGCLALRDGRRFWRQHGRGLLSGLGGALVTTAPIIQYALRYPDIYNARVNQTGLIQSGLLDRMVAASGESPWLILLDQLKRAALAFNAYPDRTAWYGLPAPLLGIVSGALFLLGFGYALSRLLNPRIFPMVVWWVGAIVIGGALTESPPASQRLITTAVPATFFIALALVTGAGLLATLVARPVWARTVSYGVLGVSVAAFGLASLKTYFIDYTPQRIYGNHDGMVATSLAHYAHEYLGPDWRIYFLGIPAMSFDFGPHFYLSPETEGANIEQLQTDPGDLRVAKPDKGAAFVALPFREAELNQLRALYPGGELERIQSPIGPEALYFVYRVPRERLAALAP